MALSNHNGTWTVTHAEYQMLKRAYEELAALEAGGVDNWEGYDTALEALDDEER